MGLLAGAGSLDEVEERGEDAMLADVGWLQFAPGLLVHQTLHK